MTADLRLIICALERAQKENQDLADKLHDQLNYDAELPAGDAELIGEAIALLRQGSAGAEHPSDFAKIVRGSNGQQALFYVSPDGDSYLLHQVLDVDRRAQFKLSTEFHVRSVEDNERAARTVFKAIDQAWADRLIAQAAIFLDDAGVGA